MDQITELGRAAEAGSSRPPGVLVILNDLGSRTAAAGELRRHGFGVWTAGSGGDALATYVDHAGDLDVLLLDDDRTNLLGPVFVQRFRQYFPGVPCIVWTRRPASPEAAVVPGPIIDRLRTAVADAF